MKVAVLGSGNGAHAVAFEWSRAGHDVYMFDFPEFDRTIRVIQEKGGITSKGMMEGFAEITYAGTDIEKVLRGAELVFAVGPAYSTEPFGKACAPYIEEGQIYVVMPSSCMGALVFKKALGMDVKDNIITVCETNTLPYAVRIEQPSEIYVTNRLITAYSVATMPRERGEEVYKLLQSVFEGIERADSILQTTLQNSNPIIHPVVTTLNAGWIERTGGDFEFYHDGITPGVGNLMEAVDLERIALGKALGLYIEPSLHKGIRQGYMTTDEDFCKAYSTAPGFSGIKAQKQLDHRYYNEDVGYTMIFWLDLAARLGVEIPITDAIVKIASAVMKRDYRKEGARTLETLGIGDFTKEELLNL